MKRINEHLVRGFTWMLPIIVLYSIAMAVDQNIRDLGALPDRIFWLAVPVLTTRIATSVTPKLLLVPGVLLGVWMTGYGLGFFGGIVGGLLLGYLGLWGCRRFRCNQNVPGLVLAYVVIPVVTLGLTYLLMRFVVSVPLLWMMEQLIDWVQSIDPTRTTLLVGVLALFTVADLGGPFNKVAFTVVLESYANGWYHISGPAIISVVIPPLSMLVWLVVMGQRVHQPDSNGKRLLVLGSLFGLTESAIPMVLEDPMRRWPAMVLGSVAASVFASHLGLTNILMMVSVPGLFGANRIGVYLFAHVLGVAIVVGLLFLFTSWKNFLHSSDTTV